MKNHFTFAITLLASTLLGCQSTSTPTNDPIKLIGPYMGQTPPGEIAEVFAPGVISTKDWEVEGVFAPGMQEFFYVTRESEDAPRTIFGYRMEGDQWHQHIQLKRTGEVFFSSDGETMHLAEGYRKRTKDGWSDVISLGPMFDRDDWGIMRLTASDKGSYYFDDYKSGDVIRVSKIIDGVRQEPIEMPEFVNQGEWTAHPFIAPDESYLIWDSEREDGFGKSDLYITFADENGNWGPAINMGPKVNSDKSDFFGSITPDGKFLMFNRTMSRTEDHIDVDLYWVDAKILEELKNQAQ